jgi:hypothetical protein
MRMAWYVLPVDENKQPGNADTVQALLSPCLVYGRHKAIPVTLGITQASISCTFQLSVRVDGANRSSSLAPRLWWCCSMLRFAWSAGLGTRAA